MTVSETTVVEVVVSTVLTVTVVIVGKYDVDKDVGTVIVVSTGMPPWQRANDNRVKLQMSPGLTSLITIVFPLAAPHTG